VRRSSSGWGPTLLLALCLSITGRLVHAEAMTLNLKDADLNAVIATVSEMTGKNFIVDPRVKGRATVISTRPMEAEELYQVFLSILNVHGFAAVPGKNAIKIVPAVNAKQDAIPTVTKSGEQAADQTVTRVIQVNNVAAAQLVPILRPLMPQEAHLAAYAPTNVLIASSIEANIDRIVELVQRIDLSSEAESELIPLKHASAGEVERILTALQQSNTKAGAAPGGEVKIIADLRTNSVLLSGDKSNRQHLKRIIQQLDTPMQSSGNTRVIYLHYAKAADLAEVLNGIAQTIVEEKAGGAAGGKGKPGTALKIQADESTNALVINAPLDVMRDLEGVIQHLDMRRAQVMVKAVVAEVSTDSAAELGIQWAYDNSASNGPVGLIDFNNTIGGLANTANGLAAPPVLDGLSLLAGDFTNGAFRFGALLRALSGDTDNNILSTPTLVTMDNEEAEIVVGQNVPFVTGSYSTTGTGSTPTNPFQTIQREDIGLKLKIKPQINEGDSIRLEITHELSSLTNSAVNASDIITNKRSVKTTVMVDDGKVLVLGGLIDDKLIETTQKVPGFGDIPVLGWLFRYQSTKKVKQDLMVFLHPRILRDEKQSMAFANEKYNYIRARQLGIRERGVKLMRDDVSPLLPQMKDFLELPPPYEQAGEPVPPPLPPASWNREPGRAGTD
jgi:general secretion pathway protein D